MRRRGRWRQPDPAELDDIRARLEQWDCPVGGAVRHMFALSAIESYGVEALRVTEHRSHWAAAIVFPGRLVAPAGDPEAIRAAGAPTRRWRLLVGDAAAADALLVGYGVSDPVAEPDTGTVRVHVQRLLTVVGDTVPSVQECPDPGLRRAEPADLPVLAELAVQLHVDDRFGPDPGRAGLRGYRARLEDSVRRGLVRCVGPLGDPVIKIERSVSSRRYGVQLAGIVARPAVRGQGLGRAAVAAAVREALAEGPSDRPISLHVRHDNLQAIHAYLRAGFADREEWRLAVHP